MGQLGSGFDEFFLPYEPIGDPCVQLDLFVHQLFLSGESVSGQVDWFCPALFLPIGGGTVATTTRYYK